MPAGPHVAMTRGDAIIIQQMHKKGKSRTRNACGNARAMGKIHTMRKNLYIFLLNFEKTLYKLFTFCYNGYDPVCVRTRF